VKSTVEEPEPVPRPARTFSGCRLWTVDCRLLALAALAATSINTADAAPASAEGCLAAGNGYLRARIRGALDLDLDWRNADVVCEGGARPGSRGIRLSFAGPLQSDGRRLRIVFGIGSLAEGRAGRALPTNVTVIFEGEKRLFATRGEDKCTTDDVRQERVGDLSGRERAYRVVARGFCTAPATGLDRSERIILSSFDFAGRVSFAGEDAAERAAATR
jgi:hypothetical protein